MCVGARAHNPTSERARTSKRTSAWVGVPASVFARSCAAFSCIPRTSRAGAHTCAYAPVLACALGRVRMQSVRAGVCGFASVCGQECMGPHGCRCPCARGVRLACLRAPPSPDEGILCTIGVGGLGIGTCRVRCGRAGAVVRGWGVVAFVVMRVCVHCVFGG